MNPILIVLLLTSAVVAFVLLFGRKGQQQLEQETPSVVAPSKEEIEEKEVESPPTMTCPVCPVCPEPKPCPLPGLNETSQQPIRIILETVGPLAHQNQIVLRENQYRPLYTPVDPSLFLKQPFVKPSEF